MFLEQKQDLSVYYLIKDTFETAGSFINIVDEYPEGEIDLPCLSIENHYYKIKALELGSRKGQKYRTWYIHIFAKNKTQRDDYGYLVTNTLEQGIPVFDYDEGFPPAVSPTQIGAMDVLELEYSPKKVDSRLVSKLYWRGQVKLVARYTLTT